MTGADRIVLCISDQPESAAAAVDIDCIILVLEEEEDGGRGEKVGVVMLHNYNGLE